MPPETRVPLSLHGLTLLASFCSMVALLTATRPAGSTPAWSDAAWMSAVFLMVLAGWRLRRMARNWADPPAIAPIFLLLFVASTLWNLSARGLGFVGQPLEAAMLTGLQWAGCGFAAASVWRQYQPLALICSLFVTMFATSISEHVSTQVAAVVFGIVAVIWLYSAYWSAFMARAVKSRSRRSAMVVWFPVLVLAVMALVLWLGPSNQMWALAGFLPSSGGDRDFDPAAQRGIGDGDALVAGQEDIQSFGPIEDAPFRSADDPSLYDVFNELYEEPAIVRQQDRAIALPPEVVQQLESRMAKSQQANREFATVRKQRPRSRPSMGDLSSEALFYVKGRVPLHLRHELFDVFDGQAWHAMPAEGRRNAPELKIAKVEGRPWLQLLPMTSSFDFYGGMEPHAIKVVHLNGARIPSPLHLRGVHIDQVADTSLFAWDGDQLLRLQRDNLPELTAIHLRSQTVEARRLVAETVWGKHYLETTLLLPMNDETPRIRRLAEEWTVGLPRGWRQVSAIVERLREEYTLDAETRPPEGCSTPTSHFLFDSRRGPDYQFATAASLLLRSLDYSTRLVGGFYASPERYDSRRVHTPVTRADAHMWVEVYLHSGTWLTVEPTPGYEVLGPPLSWHEQLAAALSSIALALLERWPVTLTFVLLAAVAWRTQTTWLDGLAVVQWRLYSARSDRARVLQTMRLLDRRLQWMQASRSPGETWRTLLQRWSLDGSLEQQRDLRAIAQLAEWAAFAPGSTPAPLLGQGSVHELCHAAVDAFGQLRRVALAGASSPRPGFPADVRRPGFPFGPVPATSFAK